MAKSEGRSNEAIGRPGPWGAGRYQEGGKPVDVSVRTPPGTVPNSNSPVSTPVTRRDYESDAERESREKGGPEPPGGDAG
jgi:hypothetical protein